MIAALAVGLCGLGYAPAALAFCRTTTCDPKDGDVCTRHPTTDCIQEGIPLHWPERCISFGVHKNGSPRQNIAYETANDIVRAAFLQWMSVDCGGGRKPSFRIWDVGDEFGGIDCDRPEFNKNEPNANVWMFRDDSWPYVAAGSTLALTTITFEVPTGQILDADVEINSFTLMNRLTTDDDMVDNDLLSIATHEAGHFLGLAHSHLDSSTMYKDYQPGELHFRTLENDDMQGICAAYPPDRDSPECNSPRPRHGFSRFCEDPVSRDGCVVAHSPAPEGAGLAVFGAAIAGLSALSARRRRRRRCTRAPRGGNP